MPLWQCLACTAKVPRKYIVPHAQEIIAIAIRYFQKIAIKIITTIIVTALYLTLSCLVSFGSRNNSRVELKRCIINPMAIVLVCFSMLLHCSCIFCISIANSLSHKALKCPIQPSSNRLYLTNYVNVSLIAIISMTLWQWIAHDDKFTVVSAKISLILIKL